MRQGLLQCDQTTLLEIVKQLEYDFGRSATQIICLELAKRHQAGESILTYISKSKEIFSTLTITQSVNP